MSFSVILITLGIIQTLLFESIAFFEELAESRGWFSFDWNFGNVFFFGLAFLIAILLAIDILSRNEESALSKLPKSIWFADNRVVKLVVFIGILQFLFIDGVH